MGSGDEEAGGLWGMGHGVLARRLWGGQMMGAELRKMSAFLWPVEVSGVKGVGSEPQRAIIRVCKDTREYVWE